MSFNAAPLLDVFHENNILSAFHGALAVIAALTQKERDIAGAVCCGRPHLLGQGATAFATPRFALHHLPHETSPSAINKSGKCAAPPQAIGADATKIARYHPELLSRSKSKLGKRRFGHRETFSRTKFAEEETIWS